MKNNIDTLMPSDKTFGYFFGFVFGAACFYFVFKGQPMWAALLGVLAVISILLAILAPAALHTLNRVWFKLGLLLGKIVSPVVLGVIFFLVIAPLGVAMRLFGRDELKLKARNDATYWKTRLPPGPRADSFANQF